MKKAGFGKNQNQNQRYQCLMALRINGMKPVWASPGYEVLMHFRINGIYALRHRPGYECLKAFTASYKEGVFAIKCILGYN